MNVKHVPAVTKIETVVIEEEKVVLELTKREAELLRDMHGGMSSNGIGEYSILSCNLYNALEKTIGHRGNNGNTVQYGWNNHYPKILN